MEAWEAEKAFDQCLNSLASLSIKYPRKVGIEGGMLTAFATAFVVSYKPLILVTNKHVITCTGLAQIDAVFLNRPLKDSVKLKVIYIDPVHDFVLCGIATKSKEHNLFSPMYPLQPLSLSNTLPERGSYIICVGAVKGKHFDKHIGKVVDNQANPPNGMDFNLGHIEGSDDSPKGFSGGPVINKNGKVVGIVASNYEERSLHIPSTVVRKVLKTYLTLQKVPRGTLNLAFKSERTRIDKDGDELDEPRVMFTVTKCMGESERILIGDELSKLRGREVTSLSQIEDVLNGSVGKEISIELLRKSPGKHPQKIKIKERVDNLHDFQIPKVLEISDAVLHSPEYNVLLFYNLSPIFKRAMFVSDDGYLLKQFGIPLHSLIIGVGNVNLIEVPKRKKDAPDSYTLFLDGIREFLTKGQYMIPIIYKVLGKSAQMRKVIMFQPRWYPTVIYYLDAQQRWRRDLIDLASLVNSNLDEAPPPENTEPEKIDYDMEDIEDEDISQGPGRFLGLLVHIRFIQPFELNGNNSAQNFVNQTSGVVIDSHRGLIACERFLVNSALGDCVVTFDGRRSVAGTVILVHPTHLFSIIKVQNKDLAANGIVIPPVHLTRFLSTNNISIADNLSYIGMTMKQSKIYCRNVSVTTREPIQQVISTKFAPKNSSYFTTSLNPGSNGIGGFFFNERTKKMVGLNVHFLSLKAFCGIQSYIIKTSAMQLVGSKLRTVDILPMGLRFPLLADAKVSHSLSDSMEMQILEEMGDFHRTMLAVDSFFARPLTRDGEIEESVTDLQESDLILSVNGSVVTNLRSFELSLTPDDAHNTIEVITQNGEEAKRDLRYMPIPAVEVDEVMIVSGAVFHRPSLHLLCCAEKNTNQLQPAAILSEIFPGSPASQAFALEPGEIKFISGVDGEKLANFDHFVVSMKELFKAIMDGETISTVSFTLSEEDLDDSIKISISVGVEDLIFWPPRQLKRDERSLQWRGNDLFHVKLKEKDGKKKRGSQALKSKSSRAASKALNVFKQGSNIKKRLRSKRKKSISSV